MSSSFFDLLKFKESLLSSFHFCSARTLRSVPYILLSSGYISDMPSEAFPPVKPAYLRSKDIVFYTANSSAIDHSLDDPCLYDKIKKCLQNSFQKNVYSVQPASIAQSFNLIPSSGFFPWHNDRNNLTVLFVASGSSQSLNIRYPCFLIRQIYRLLEYFRSYLNLSFIYRYLFVLLKPLSFVFSTNHSVSLNSGNIIIFDGHLCFHSISNDYLQSGSHFVFAYDVTNSFDFNHQLSTYYGQN